jgi:hypothetical protein
VQSCFRLPRYHECIGEMLRIRRSVYGRAHAYAGILEGQSSSRTIRDRTRPESHCSVTIREQILAFLKHAVQVALVTFILTNSGATALSGHRFRDELLRSFLGGNLQHLASLDLVRIA